jgi:ABC-type branched-subunit amino acid transport system substrate-binding protein
MGASFALTNPTLRPWVKAFVAKFGKEPDDYSVTAHDAGEVILDASDRLTKSVKAVNHDMVRDAIQTTHVVALQKLVAFDPKEDIKTRQVSVLQVIKDPEYPAG